MAVYNVLQHYDNDFIRANMCEETYQTSFM